MSDLYRYSAVNRELTEALRGFAADQRLNIVFDPSIERVMISEEVAMPPNEFLNYITGKYGLVWYYDGVSLYVYRGASLTTRAFRLRFTTASRVIEAMKRLNVYSDRFSFRTLENDRMILAIAPPRMLEMTGLVIGTLEAGGRSAVAESLSIAVFPLRFASAADQTFDFQGSSINMPGVATVLQSLVSGNPVSGNLTSHLPRNLPSLTGYGLDRFSQQQKESLFNPEAQPNDPQSTQPADPIVADAQDLSQQAPPRGQVIQPTISADPRTNSVVVRAPPHHIETYRQVVEALDKPTGLIEITAKIIDITKEGVFEWGLPYDFEVASGDSSRALSIELAPTDSANLAVTLLKDEVTQFMGQIKALEQDGNARVESRPSLLTMDNVEAQIDNSETFFVRVEGDFEVDLFDVSVGTTLQINPHVIEQGGRRMVRLAVQITDGAVLEQTVDEIPRVRTDTITTQAVLGENESLLIGGLFREERSSVETRIPFLGGLPGVGKLFRTEEYNTSRVERLILIEPRIVAIPTVVNGALQLTPLDLSLPLQDTAGAIPPGSMRRLPQPVPTADPAETSVDIQSAPQPATSARRAEIRVADRWSRQRDDRTAIQQSSAEQRLIKPRASGGLSSLFRKTPNENKQVTRGDRFETTKPKSKTLKRLPRP